MSAGDTLLTDAVGQSLVKVVDGTRRHFADGVLVEAIFERFFKLEKKCCQTFGVRFTCTSPPTAAGRLTETTMKTE